MPKTEAQKRAQKAWIEKNKEYHRALQNMYTKKYYEENREKVLEKQLARYYLKKQLKAEKDKESENENQEL